MASPNGPQPSKPRGRLPDQQHINLTQPMVMAMGSMHGLAPPLPAPLPTITHLLISADPDPDPTDFSDLAQLTRYAKRPNQVHRWHWHNTDVQRITAIVTEEWEDRISAYFNTPAMLKRTTWREYHGPANWAIDAIMSFVCSRSQSKVHWRMCEEHARFLACVDLMESELTLQAWADLLRVVEGKVKVEDGPKLRWLIEGTHEALRFRRKVGARRRI
ncbi:hypothetical protein EJ04DRAFT_566949 [Polyplosphaeria fusca]|uniref:Uncharacterized protein n=1 Tax=Polyplosphaeria fusca TaxID=682080 RepID=A0A9P4QPJ7_9PLEO|nr:hypothetical protein EJ04DRAFT_566949 [Polyplosphaeria fusca]